MSETSRPETLDEFKASFAYGTRNDLAFKFLKRLSAEEAGEFFQELLRCLGETVDDGDSERLIELAYGWQVRAYTGPQGERGPTYEDRPFQPLIKPLASTRLALLTSSGHFAAGHDPRPFGVEAMTQEEATARIVDFLREAPQLSEIDAATPDRDLRVRHGGYDIRGALADPGVVFPLDLLRQLEAEHVIGGSPPHAFSFVGAAAQTRLLRQSAPEWIARLTADAVDAVLLVPA